MIFALGFLTAGLLALAAAPAFWRRAERLSRRRLEISMPLSPREVVAERDALRATFAVETRRMERAADERAGKLAAVQGELGRELAGNHGLKVELAASTARFGEQGALLERAQRDLREAETGQVATEKALYDADATALAKGRRVLALEQALSEAERLAEERRASLSAAEARIAGLAAHLDSADRARQAMTDDLRALDDLRSELRALRLKAEASALALTDARSEVERLRRLGQARGAANLADIADLDDPRLREAIHGIGTTIARLSGGAGTSGDGPVRADAATPVA